MNLTINIDNLTSPVIRESKKDSIISRWIMRYVDNYLERRTRSLNEVLDRSILSVEGSFERLRGFDSNQAKEFLINSKEGTEKTEKWLEELSKHNFFEDIELKKKYKYFLKCIYKSEAIAHKIAFREVMVNKTDDYLKEGVIRMNSNYFKDSGNI